MSSSSTGLPTPEGPGSVSGAPNLPDGFTDTFTSRYVDTGDAAPARGRRRRRPAAAAGPRLAPDLVRLAPADAGAGPGLRGHRGRPARHRALRQARGRLRHRHPRRRPGRADGRARPPAVRRVRDRHRHADRLRAGRGSPRPGRAPGRLRGAPPGRVSLAARCSSRRRSTTGSGTSPFNQLARGERAARPGTGGHLLRRRVRRLGRDEQAARRRRQVLRRHASRRPRRAARQLRALPRVPHHHRAERAAQDPAADHARPGDGRRGELRRRWSRTR